MAVGAIHHKNLGLSDADKARLSVELIQLGGTSESHELTDEALRASGADSSAG